MKSRIGFGYDVHQLSEGRPFRLGGMDIEYTKGAVGHSDADVLVHAICDALLGAAALGDIGTHFPNNDPKYKGINSLRLLKQVTDLLKSAGYEISNIDSTVCLQEPKIQSRIPEMRKRLSETMNLDNSQVSIKATTEEGMGISGSGNGVSAYAVCLISKK